MTFVRPPLDFTVSREDWCRYDLADGAILKVKIILTKVRRQQNNYTIDFQVIYLVLTNERGTPEPRQFTQQELQTSVTNEVRFTTTSQDWNEYIVDDGGRIRIQPMLTRIDRTSRFDAGGEPIYLVQVQGTTQITPPPPFRPT